MLLRRADIADIPAMHRLRLAVRENQLSNPASIGEGDYAPFFTERGAGWVAEAEGRLVGFAILDLAETSVWALFVAPEMEGKGIGGALHREIIAGAIGHGIARLSLATAPGTRAERFYEKAGWRRTGRNAAGETLFERAL